MANMEDKCHPFFGLGDDAEAFNCFLKSRLMLASNFLVGTRFNSSRFSFASKGELL